MRLRLAIGDFSRMTHLSVKALRHYHDVGLLVPCEIDPASGYRFYEPGQVRTAQVIRRLRDLGMPLEEIGAILTAPDVGARNRVLAEHARRMEAQLAVTRAVVHTLRSLLDEPPAPVAMEHRSVAAQPAFAVTDRISVVELDAWWDAAFKELDAALAASGERAAGPRAALYSPEFFEVESGEVVAYIPVEKGGAGTTEIPAAELVIAVHRGGFADLDLTFGALGVHVAEREIGISGPIREHYVVCAYDSDDEARFVTEVGWPVFRTRSGSPATGDGDAN